MPESINTLIMRLVGGPFGDTTREVPPCRTLVISVDHGPNAEYQYEEHHYDLVAKDVAVFRKSWFLDDSGRRVDER